MSDRRTISMIALLLEGRLLINGVVCYTCVLPISRSPSPLSCGACQRVTYCSEKCWANDPQTDGHRAICLDLVAQNKSQKECGPKTWDERYQELSKLSTKNLPANNTDDAKAFLKYTFFQEFCVDCYRTKFELQQGHYLNSCKNCFLVFSCGSCVQPKEANGEYICSQCTEPGSSLYRERKTAIETGIAFLFHVMWGHRLPYYPCLGTNRPPFCFRGIFEKPRQSFKSLSTIEGWYDYHYTMALQYSLDEDIDKETLLPLREQPAGTAYTHVYLNSTEGLSFVLTIYAALEKALASSNLDLSQRMRLEVHVIDATEEILRAFDYETFLHLLPSLKAMRWVFVFSSPYPISYMKMGVCDDCMDKGRAISCHYVHMDSYLRSTKELAVVFDSEFLSKPEYLPILKHLISGSVMGEFCTVFTSWSADTMARETGYLVELGANLIVEGQENKWQSKRPIFKQCRENPHLISYANKYWWMIKSIGQ
ncbi:hypothetical protein DSL72_005165 [Monilinia vaccinii-corymbosi]|uniref:MYND-type domain-containing protein n=1 Tax=Monilinia vaccinii-corymbosi TaxID=61207 RepID=A0A8A3PEF9_9HELO|nr:hypothetical protein DSL72_005165 [Monilinia vaccinii-corymbosi]